MNQELYNGMYISSLLAIWTFLPQYHHRLDQFCLFLHVRRTMASLPSTSLFTITMASHQMFYFHLLFFQIFKLMLFN